MASERGARLAATGSFQLPELGALLPDLAVVALNERHLHTRYFDTLRFNLARSGITFYHRTGEAGPAWTLQLPENRDVGNAQPREMTFVGLPDSVPATARDLLSPYTRTRMLINVVTLETSKYPLELRRANGERVATVIDEHIYARHEQHHPVRFRKIEVMVNVLGPVGDLILQTIVDQLIAAGCWHESDLSELLSTLGPESLEPPDLVIASITRDARLNQLVRHTVAFSVTQILNHDPLIRLGKDPEDVHRYRVAIRRLRADLQTFKSLLEPELVRWLLEELGWLGDAVGAARDSDILREHLGSQALTLTRSDMTGERILAARLVDESASSHSAMLMVLRSTRYLALLEVLIDTANSPPVRRKQAHVATRKAADVGINYVYKPWRRLRRAVDDLDRNPTDVALHHVRILAKQCRYAAEALEPVIDDACVFVKELAKLQSTLGEHQDAVVAEQWLHEASADLPNSAHIAAELVNIQRSQKENARDEWRMIWKRVFERRPSTWS